MRKNLYSVTDEDLVLKAEDIFDESIVKKCFNSVSGLVIGLDINGNIIFANEQLCKTLEYDEIELTQKNWLIDIVENDENLKSHLKDEDLIPKDPNKIIHTLKTKSNKKIIIEARHVIFKDNKNRLAGVIVSGEDITKSVLKDEENERELKIAVDKAEVANKAKNSFLTSISHEIRTPLNALIGFSEQLNKTNLSQKQKKYVKIIERASGYLLNLVDEILEFSKIESGEIYIEDTPFSPVKIIDEIFSMFKLRAEEKNIRFNYSVSDEADNVVIGDSFRLKQVLLNITENAIKYTDEGYVKICCSVSNESENVSFLRFDIIDTGIGIPEDKLQLVFNQFTHEDPAIAKRFGGTGLGLTISKKLIELLNGRISVKSKLGIGSVFTFTIPFKKTDVDDFIEEEPEENKFNFFNKLKVLLIDDDSVNRLLGKTILNNFHCKVDLASNGWEAMEKLRKNKYDLILLDIHMPEVSGIDVAKFVRKDLNDNSTKIIAVTAAVLKNDIALYYSSGINDYLVKPFKEKSLFYKINKNLNNNILSLKLEPKIEPIMETVTAYNLTELKKIAKDDTEFIKKMLTTFINNSVSDIKKIKEGTANKDWKQVGEVAHKMLPSYRHLQINNVVADLMTLKIKCLIEPDFDNVPPIVERISHEVDKVLSMLKKEIS